MIKPFVQVGNSKAIVVDKSIIQAAGLNDDTLFQITVNPNGGIVIESVEPMNDEEHQKIVRSVIQKNHDLLKRLKDR